jgi:uncharacterized protein (DUF302 family)
MDCSALFPRQHAESLENAAMLTRRDVVVGVLAASLAVALSALAVMGSSRHKEPNMSAGDSELVTLPSAHSATKTVERFKALLAEKGIELFAQIDHASGAKKVGQSLRPTQVLIFGNPKVGTPLMQNKQIIGLDLPLRVLVWEDEAGKVWLSYRRVENLTRMHHITGQDETGKGLDSGLEALARAATSN